MSQFDEVVQGQLERLQAELADALIDDDYAGAAWAESAILDLHRLRRENTEVTVVGEAIP